MQLLAHDLALTKGSLHFPHSLSQLPAMSTARFLVLLFLLLSPRLLKGSVQRFQQSLPLILSPHAVNGVRLIVVRGENLSQACSSSLSVSFLRFSSFSLVTLEVRLTSNSPVS